MVVAVFEVLKGLIGVVAIDDDVRPFVRLVVMVPGIGVFVSVFLVVWRGVWVLYRCVITVPIRLGSLFYGMV